MALLFADVITEVAQRLRIDTANDSTLNTMVTRWLNETIQDIHSRYDWFWAVDRAVVQTATDTTTGTVSVATSGTTVTGSSTAFASSDVGRFIQFQNSNDWYRITAVASTTSLTIEAGYTATTSLSGGTYKIRTIFYTLSSAEKILDVTQAQTWQKLTSINYRDFDMNFTNSDATGKATIFFVYGLDSSQNIRFSIYPHADAVFNLEIRYKKKAVEDALTVIPEKWRPVYVDGALARGLEYVAIGQPQFDRAQISLKRNDLEMGIKRMLADCETESDYHPVIQSKEAANVLRGPKLPDGLSIPLD